MKGVILAAGRGRRMAPISDSIPKCLMDFDGRSLLAWYIEALQFVGISDIAIVVGYRKDQIVAETHAIAPKPTFQWITNDQFSRGSIYSLWLAQAAFDDDMLIMDADILFPKVFLTRLLNSKHANALLIDQTVTQSDEECMVVTDSGRVRSITKTPPPGAASHGEGVGFLKLALPYTKYIIEALSPYIANGNLDVEYEHALDEFFNKVYVGYEEIGTLPWIEMDSTDDRNRALEIVLPKIQRINTTAEKI